MVGIELRQLDRVAVALDHVDDLHEVLPVRRTHREPAKPVRRRIAKDADDEMDAAPSQ